MPPHQDGTGPSGELAALRHGPSGDLAALRHHGDVDAAPGLLDLAVNVRGDRPPAWLLAELAPRLADLAAYPGAAEERAAREAVAARHGRDPAQVLLLAGAAEGFALLPALRPAAPVVLAPSFTEPELALREAGLPVRRAVLAPPHRLSPGVVPEDADLVVLGNPTNPTSVLHPREAVLALRRPGRVVVVDEAFCDAVPGEEGSVAGLDLPDVLVLRSLTKTYALAGLRVGYALGDPALLARLAHGRPHWPLGLLQLTALRACSTPAAQAWAQEEARTIAAERTHLAAALTAAGLTVVGEPRAPFLLLHHPRGEELRERLRRSGIAVRRCDTFPGLGPGHLRVAVRGGDTAARLVAAVEVAVREVEERT